MSLSPRRYAPMGGSFAVVWVAAFTWNGWQASVEYASITIILSDNIVSFQKTHITPYHAANRS